ncbi:hypothetical protein N7493_000156 [Penicillium malachiteum]|uniref:Lysine-specific metallo-endopeptidase domain-containing protein n=1 Tax=Penicillium malachiteum TaxID=1324776 RepID=A0AAD6HVS8_9EURO|nr:hypothetical protein N7493_000156 [Penicillium malachiteum]
MLVTLGRILLLASALQCAQGLRIVPDHVFKNNRTSVVGRRDDGDAIDNNWTPITDWETFLLHTRTCGSSDAEADAAVSVLTIAEFGDILNDVKIINEGAYAATSTLQSAWTKMSNNEELSTEEKSQIDFYMAMYGTFKKDDNTGMTRASGQISRLTDFSNAFVQGLELGIFNIRIIWEDTAFELIDYINDDTSEKEEGWSFGNDAESFVITRKSTSQNSICEDADGNSLALAFVMPGTADYDYLTICPEGWTAFNEATTISAQKAKSVSDLEYEDLDTVVKKPAESIFIHELTHAGSFWGTLKTDDVALSKGDKAYGFEKIVQLAEEGNSEDDATELKSLKNADTYAYWAVAH